MKTEMKMMVLGAMLTCALCQLASALDIKPDTGTLGSSRWQGTVKVTSDGDYLAAITAIIGQDANSIQLYKVAASGTESGALANSYDFTKTYDPNGDWDGGLIVHVTGQNFLDTSKDAWLGVKDGNHGPWWYLFKLNASDINWNGTDTLVLKNFWETPPTSGTVSSISLFGGQASRTPDGSTTISLLGMAMVGLGMLQRRIRK